MYDPKHTNTRKKSNHHIKSKSMFSSCVLLGDIMIDSSIYGNISRLSPEVTTVPIVKQTHKTNNLGGAGNLLLNICSVMNDIPVTVLFKVGSQLDENTLLVTSLLDQVPNTNTTRLIFTNDPTITKTRVFVEGRMISRVDDEIITKLPTSLDHIELNKAILVVVSDYDKGMCHGPYFEEFMTRAYEANCIIVVDPKQTNINVYKYATVLKPNLRELLQFDHHKASDDHKASEVMNMSNDKLVEFLSEKCKVLIDSTKIRFIVVTLEHRGIFMFSNQYIATYSPQTAVKIVNVVGAGDTTMAVMISLLQKHGIDFFSTHPMDMLKYACAGGQAAVQFNGNFHLTDAMLSFINRDLPSHKLILCKKDLQWDPILVHSFSKSVLAKQQQLVVSNGCFDICHAGHIKALIEAKEQGHIHVVALNTDESITQLKGHHRPINKLHDRLQFLCSLPFVDLVVAFNEKSPKLLYSHLRPAVIVKGAEYHGKYVAGEEYAQRIHLVNQLEGCSTTNIIQKVISTL